MSERPDLFTTRRAALMGAGAAAVLAGRPALAAFGQGSGFSVSGKQGPFIQQVSKRNLVQDAAAAGSMGFGGDATGAFQSGRLRMPETERRLKAMVDQLAAKWPYAKPAEIKVHMLGDGKYAPQALPDGSIVVPLGFLVQAESDDEVAFVLGHEFGHIGLAHFARNTRVRDQRRLVTTLAQSYEASVRLSQIRLDRSGPISGVSMGDQNRADRADRHAAAAKDRLDWVLNNLVDPAWNRRQEDEADAIGYDLAKACGYSADAGSDAAFSRLTADAEGRLALVKSLQAQMNLTAQHVEEEHQNDTLSSLTSMNPGQMLRGLSHAVGNGVRMGVEDSMDRMVAPRHRPPQMRRKGVGDYSAAAYPSPEGLSDLKTSWLSDVRSTREFAAAKVAVQALQDAQEKRGEPDYPAAMRAIKVALATPFGTSPLFLNEAGRIARDSGDLRGAETWFAKADLSVDQTLDGYRDHARLLMMGGQYPAALKVVQTAAQRIGTDKDLLPELVRIKFKTGQTEEGTALLQRCVDLEDPVLGQQCATAAYGPDDAEWARISDDQRARIDAASRKSAARMAAADPVSNALKAFNASGDRD